MKKAKTLLLVPMLFCLACSDGPKGSQTEPNLALPEVNVTEEGYLVLDQNALDREFLLQASFIVAEGWAPNSPNFNGSQSRIITFKKKNGSVFMMESNEGLLSSEEIPMEWILSEFKIIEENETAMTIDFNEGMKGIFIGSDWYASDAQYGRDPTLSIRAPHAFLKEVKTEGGRVVIRQAAQLEIPFGVNYLWPVEIVYYLEPYQTNENFAPVANPGFDEVGFFEINPLVRPDFGDYQTYISRWDIRQPVVFAVSDNTPPEYVEAIKEGVLYWNKAFGSEVVQVTMAPAGVRAPDPNHNVIQWVTNHYAGAAYADAQMDPRTGQILHAQIFFPSTWTVPTLSLFDQMESSDDQAVEDEAEDENGNIRSLVLGLKGFNPGLLCIYPAKSTPANLKALAQTDAATALKMTQDLVRDVVAHEVGHTLGLRHNFAASTGSKLLPKQISDLFETYLESGAVQVPQQVVSSVMDYGVLEESVLNGRFLSRSDGPPLTYDETAIAWGYHQTEPSAPLEEILYCSDSLAFRYNDCRLWDGSGHPLLASANRFEQRIEKLPNLLAEIFLSAKTHFDPEEREPVGLIPLPAEFFAYYITVPLREALNLLRENAGRSLLVERQTGPATDVNQGEVEQKTVAWLDAAVTGGGGIQNIFKPIAEHLVFDRLNGAYEQFAAIIENPGYRSGQTPFGESYAFSDLEIGVMKEKAQALFALTAQKTVRQATEILVGGEVVFRRPFDAEAEPVSPREISANRFRSIGEIDALESALGNWAENIVTDGAETVPTFESGVRLQAAQILLPYQGPTADWQEANRQRVLALLLEKLEARYGRPFQEIDPSTLAGEAMALYQAEQTIIAVLSMSPSVGDAVPTAEDL